jgi:hypothetical protein
MRSAITCLVLLGLLALSSARQQDLVHALAKKSLIETRTFTTACQNAVRACNNTLQNYLASLSPTDPQLEQKVCRAARTFYDCVKRGTSSCYDAQFNQAMREVLAEFRAICPREFQGATLF